MIQVTKPDLGRALQGWHQRSRADPLADFTVVARDGRRHEAQARLIAAVSGGAECLLLGANRSGKTLCGAALALALARGRPRLGDCLLPRLPKPSVGGILTESWKQQIESTQQTVLELLGDWPYQVRHSHQVPLGAVLILVRPEAHSDDDPESWSRIWFHVKGTRAKGESVIGANWDWAWADEPPSIDDWREVRMRSRGDRNSLRWITMTPKWREDWEPLLRDFAGCEHNSQGGRLLIRTTLDDNPFLSDQHKSERRQAARGDIHERSRLYGEPVDVSGACPFRAEFLDPWADRCRDPELVTEVVFAHLERRTGIERRALMATWELYVAPIRGHSYYLNIDTSMGMDDQRHDPGGIHVYDRSDPDGEMVARFKGFLEPYALGELAAKMATRYHQAYADLEMNHRGALLALRALREAGHHNFVFDLKEDRHTGQVAERIGWVTEQNRGLFVAAIQSAMLRGRYPVASRGVVEALRAFRYVESRERRAEGPGDEDVILLGRWLYIQPLLGAPLASPLEAPSGFAAAAERRWHVVLSTPPALEVEERWYPHEPA